MNKQLKDARRRIQEVTLRLEPLLGITNYISVEHHFITTTEDNEDEGGAQASTRTQWEYRTATIKWRLHEIAAVDDFELERTAIHEYVHVLIDPFACLIPKEDLHSKLEELAVESIARAIQSALRA